MPTNATRLTTAAVTMRSRRHDGEELTSIIGILNDCEIDTLGDAELPGSEIDSPFRPGSVAVSGRFQRTNP